MSTVEAIVENGRVFERYLGIIGASTLKPGGRDG